MTYELPWMPPDYFDWLTWRAGCVSELGLRCREYSLTSPSGQAILRAKAVGYCEAEKLVCRPKIAHMALMVFHDERHFWFHLTCREFEKIFAKTI